jgi:hypothetical protein
LRVGLRDEAAELLDDELRQASAGPMKSGKRDRAV